MTPQQICAAQVNQIRMLQTQLAGLRGSGRTREAELIRELQKKIGSANWANWQMTRWTFYDYIRYTAAGVNNLDFFAVALGGVDPVSTTAKTLEQTNLTKTRSFGQVYFILQQIKTHVHLLPKQRQASGVISDTTSTLKQANVYYRAMYDILNQGVLNITLGQKAYFDIPQPFRFCPPGFGVDVHSMACAGTTNANNPQNMWWQQSDEPDDMYNVTPPQMIEPEQNIQATINFDNANSPSVANTLGANNIDARVDIGLIFEGYIIRPTQ